MKKLSALLPIIIMGIFVAPARAGRIEPTPVSCWLFREDKLELNQTCTYESVSWAGGGTSSLRWEDGVRTQMAWGLQGRGERPCPDTSIDGVCAVRYFRHPTSLKRISAEEEAKNRLVNRQSSAICLQVGDKSICWLR
ncbi:hypothetical protein [Microcoleus sp. PH2017_26_ELK_O_A]|nr:hypothetical protein [Microcoleus sp. PH2017_26_ELK_O_A]MCC3600067.1 hypothetical protein [Microcoleus sp. PH2017_26_ELK_O_A]